MASSPSVLGLIRRICIVVSLLASIATPAGAQGVFDAVGTRALGMGGAFIGVANDPSTTQWNPAGLVNGGPFGLTIGWHRFQLGNQDEPLRGVGSRGDSNLTSVGTWPLGISYGSLEKRRVQGSEAEGFLVRRVTVRHAGVTVLQTVVEGLVVGSTIRVLRAETAEDPTSAATLSAALDADIKGNLARRTTIDADLGVMATAPRARVGFSLRNLRSLAVRATPGNEVTLPRQGRVGVAILPADGVTLAMDLDLNTVDLMGDLRRMTALGAEISLGSRLLVRSGVRWNLALSSGPAGAVGASVMVRQGLWIDTHYAHGATDEARQMSVAFRGGL